MIHDFGIISKVGDIEEEYDREFEIERGRGISSGKELWAELVAVNERIAESEKQLKKSCTDLWKYAKENDAASVDVLAANYRQVARGLLYDCFDGIALVTLFLGEIVYEVEDDGCDE